MPTELYIPAKFVTSSQSSIRERNLLLDGVFVIQRYIICDTVYQISLTYHILNN